MSTLPYVTTPNPYVVPAVTPAVLPNVQLVQNSVIPPVVPQVLPQVASVPAVGTGYVPVISQVGVGANRVTTGVRVVPIFD